MAIKLYQNYTNVIPPSADYPFGSFKNETAPFNYDGTPFERKWPDDLQGLLQRLIDQADIVPNGVPDTVLDSDYMDALLRVFELRTTYVDTGAANVYQLTALSGGKTLAYVNGMVVRFQPLNTNTGASTLQIETLGAKPIVYYDGTAVDAGVLLAGRYSIVIFDSANDYFILHGISPAENLKQVNSISGLVPEVSGVDPDHDIIFNVGAARAANSTLDIKLPGLLIKQIDAAWMAGTNQGGLFSGGVAINTTYHFAVIRKDSDGSVDAGFSTDISFSDIPAGYTSYRRIGSILTDSSANIRGFTAFEISGGAIKVVYEDINVDIFNFSPIAVGARAPVNLSAPIDIFPIVHFISFLSTSATLRILLFTSYFQTDVSPQLPIGNPNRGSLIAYGSTETQPSSNFDMMADGLGRIYYRVNGSGDTLMSLGTMGFTDRRVN